jgi:hypothetical protein
MFNNVKHALMITGLGALLGVGVYFLYGGFNYDEMYKNANVWYKVSSDKLNPGKIVALDMSSGYSGCEGGYVYIIVKEVGSDEDIVVAFPDKGKWHAEKVDTISVEIQKYFGKLEEDLRK